MASWHEPRRESTGLLGYIAIALMPAFGVGAYFALDFALQWLAGWFV